MSTVSVIGLDIAKNVFQVHAIDERGEVLDRRKIRRAEMLVYFGKLSPCLIGIEACATAHYWGRMLGALGHEVRLMPPQYVKPYVKRSKTDAADAEAICEAVSRPSMRFVGIKSSDQQAILVLHRSRDLLVRQRTMLSNALRGHLAEFGIIETQGMAGTMRLVAVIADAGDARVPDLARQVLGLVAEQLHGVKLRIEDLKRAMMAWHKQSPVSQLLAGIPGIGPVTATAIAATVPDASVFASGRQFSAWLGLVPRQHSSGGKQRLGRITKRGDGYLRRLLVTGATAALERSKSTRARPWVQAMLKRHPKKKVAVALANKMARTAWAIMNTGEVYRAPQAAG
ncbi:MAG: IS110 family transposase [Rhodospirillaceae bacterium]|jgi:transposase|nr:IS110 family transposase [Rhodospirillaceae bacterium]MBT3885444.1 IS110 family transposase [Rhodospirillaceae bacterium]MBT4116129.1 IS110 family transposase [Rhodospirillaceae bacterium]MBT6859584.1 IS110 family transposase [Rhodospirillaceae bacterium]MBT7231516.1 IS110 family transposase [Rhodospirillaceae bacterium]